MIICDITFYKYKSNVKVKFLITQITYSLIYYQINRYNQLKNNKLYTLNI